VPLQRIGFVKNSSLAQARKLVLLVNIIHYYLNAFLFNLLLHNDTKFDLTKLNQIKKHNKTT